MSLGRRGDEVEEPVKEAGGDSVEGATEEGCLAVGLVGEGELELAPPGGFGEEGEEVDGGGGGGVKMRKEEIRDIGPEGMAD